MRRPIVYLASHMVSPSIGSNGCFELVSALEALNIDVWEPFVPNGQEDMAKQAGTGAQRIFRMFVMLISLPSSPVRPPMKV